MSYQAAAQPGLHIELTLDQRQTLKSASQRLCSEFSATTPAPTIEHLLHSSYQQLADRATLHDFLVLLAERFARHRLRALAQLKVNSTQGKPLVLFLCRHNAGRSPMAKGFFTHFAGDAAVAWSGGSQPKPEINPAAVAAMAERGIDITGEHPKLCTDEIIRAADLVVTIGCRDTIPTPPDCPTLDWAIDDPDGKDMAAVRPIRDEIEDHVRRLIDGMGLPCRA